MFYAFRLFGHYLLQYQRVFLHLSSYHHLSLSSLASQFYQNILSYIVIEILRSVRHCKILVYT